MRITARVALGLGIFVLTAGLVLWFTAHERTGAPLLVILSAGFFYIARVLRSGSRHEGEAEADAEHGEGGAPEPEVSPTIWPFGFSIAAVGLVLGVVLARWLLVVGIALVALCGAGWYRDLRRQHAHRSAG
jgi:hypothetical protein